MLNFRPRPAIAPGHLNGAYGARGGMSDPYNGSDELEDSPAM